MTIQEVIDKLSKTEDKTMPVTMYDHEYGNYYELESIEIKNIPNDEFYHNAGKRVIVLDS
jgi:hypothetical protein